MRPDPVGEEAGMTAIDLEWLGHPGRIAAWRVGDVLIDCGPETTLPALLSALDGWRPRALLLTHIHFDHAGAAGFLAREWPDLEIWVHRSGARHLTSPERLVASARRVFGADFDRIFGSLEPVPGERLRPLDGGETVHGFSILYTPGHASHHVAYLHEDTGRAFVGDVAGVCLTPGGQVVPPTPPPDVDLDLWVESLDAIAAWRPLSLGLPHFGLVEEPERHLIGARREVERHDRLARTLDQDAYVAAVGAELCAAVGSQLQADYRRVVPLEQNHVGLRRWIDRGSWDRTRSDRREPPTDRSGDLAPSDPGPSLGEGKRPGTVVPMRNPVPVESGSPFKALNNRRAFEQIIVQIEDAILDGRLRPGDRLPSERELADTFHVSRASVREALRVLEMFGVVVARRGTGPDAGSVVAASAESGIHSALRLHTSLLQIPTKDVVEVRALLEGQAAYEAAHNAQLDDLERLRATILAMEAATSIQDYHALDTEFHVELSRASGNALLPVLMEALRAVMHRDMVEAFAALKDWRAERDRLVVQHQSIVTLVEKRDADAAAKAVREHVVGFYRHVVERGVSTRG